MTACQIRCRVKPHCSCNSSETLNSSCTPSQHNLRHRCSAQAEDRQTTLAEASLHSSPSPFLKGRGVIHILQPTNADDALGPWGILKRQQQPLPDRFSQPGTCLLCSPKLSWGKRASRHRLNCSSGRTCMAGGLWTRQILSEKHPACMEKLSVIENLLLHAASCSTQF